VRTALLILLIVSSLLSQDMVLRRPIVVGGGASFLVNEDAEGTGTPSGWTDSGTIDWDYTTTVITGAQSLHLPPASSNTTKYSLSATGEVWARFKIRQDKTGSVTRIMQFNGSSTERMYVGIATNALRITHGSATATTVSTMAANTTYNVWVRYKKGTGADGEGTIAFSTTNTEPTTGNDFASLTTGSSTGDVDEWGPFNQDAPGGTALIFDDLTLDDVAIGNF
jgi:hypothetical protein